MSEEKKFQFSKVYLGKGINGYLNASKDFNENYSEDYEVIKQINLPTTSYTEGINTTVYADGGVIFYYRRLTRD